MSISRSFSLNTTLSEDELLAPFYYEVVTMESGDARYITGTRSLLNVRPDSPQFDWMCSFGVEYNMHVSVRIDNETAPETMRLLDDVVGPFIKAVGGEGWIQHHDIPFVHWSEGMIRVDSSRYGTERVVQSLEAAGLDYQAADLWSEYNAEV